MVMWWHRESYRGDLVAAQKSMLQDSMSAASNYNNVIMLAGFAAIFGLLTQGQLTPATKLCAALFLAASVAIFVALELMGMVIRSGNNTALLRAVNDQRRFEEHVRNYQENIAAMGRRLWPIQRVGMWIAIGAGVISFSIICCGLLHGLWLAFLSDSLGIVKGS